MNWLAALKARWQACGPVGRARIWLGAAALALFAGLILAPKPWNVNFSPDHRWTVRDYVAVYFWAAALGNFLILAVLGWSAKSWAFPSAPMVIVGTKSPRWFWPAVLAGVLALGCFAIPRMGHSLWHDEASRVKRTMVGEYQAAGDGSYVFEKVSWLEALFDSDLPNHVLQSALSKLCHDVWMRVAGPQEFLISEAAIRWPSLMAALAGIVFLALLLKDLGFPGAGVAAAWILALHPWYLRYAAEARGYAIVLAMVPLLVLAFRRAVMTGRDAWWGIFGIAQLAMVYAYVTAVFVPLVLNLAAPPTLAALQRQGHPMGQNLRKWLVTCILSAAAFVQMYLPNAPQLLAYVRSERSQGLGEEMGMAWFLNVAAQFWAGIPWSNTQLPESDYIEFFPIWHAAPRAGFLTLAVTIGLLLFGMVRLWKLGPFGKLAMATFTLPAPLCIIETILRKGFLYEWYVIFGLPGMIALVCLGGSQLLDISMRFRPAAAVILALFAASFVLVSQPMRWWLATHSVQPFREATLAARPSLDPNALGQNQIWTAYIHVGPRTYDPRAKRCSTIAEMRELMTAADHSHCDLFFIVGYLGKIKVLHPSKFTLLKTSGLFEDVGIFRGQKPQLSMQVFRYRRGLAESFDFSQYPEDKNPPAQWLNYY